MSQTPESPDEKAPETPRATGQDDDTQVTPLPEPTAAQPFAWAPDMPETSAQETTAPEPEREPALAGVGAPSTSIPYGAYGLPDPSALPVETPLETPVETPASRGIRMRTIVFGLVLFATAVSVLLSQLTSVHVDPGAVALAVMIGAGILLLVAGARRNSGD